MRFPLVCFGWLVLATACAPEEPDRVPPRAPLAFTDPEVRGPFAVGRRREFIVGRGRRFEADVYYPADALPPAGRDEYSAINGSTVLDAPPLMGQAPYALAVFSHGLAGLREQNTFQVEYLASHGWIVLTIDHEGSRLWDQTVRDDAADLLAAQSAAVRPDEVAAAIDALQLWATYPRHSFYGLANTAQVAVLGHSFGGYTALAMGNAEYHIADFKAYCAGRTDFKCDIMKIVDLDADILQKGDGRVKAIVPLTPGATHVFGPRGIGKIGVPVLLVAGTADTVTPPSEEDDYIPALLRVPFVYLKFHGAGHLSFSQLCLVLDFSGNCGAPPVPPREILHRTNVYTVAFLQYYVRGMAEYQRYLEPAFARQVDWVDYQAELR